MLKKRSLLGKIFLSVFVVSVLLGASEIVNAKKSKKGSSKRSASSKSASKKSGSKRSASSKSAKKGSSKRSASSKKGSSKRSASSRSSKRSASSRSSKRAASRSRNGRRAAVTNARRAAAAAGISRGAGTVGSGFVAIPNDPNACPIGKVVSFSAEEKKYYSAKNKTCNIPANAHEESWTEDSGFKKLQWIDEADAYYFVCEEGFMEKDKACVDAYAICPIGVPVEKKDKDYINPNTEESCSVPSGAATKKVSKEEAEEWGIEVGYMFSCKENYYAEEVKGTEGYFASCAKCPADKKSLAGSVGVESCKEAKYFCEPGTAFDDATQKCVECKAGEFSTGAGAECKSCLATGVETCDIKTGEILTCNKPYELEGKACVNKCTAGTYLTGSECKACAPGTWSEDGALECIACQGSATCDPKTGKATSCKAGSKLVDGACVLCDVNTYSKGGTATSCTDCESGWESASGASECKKGEALKALEAERAKYQNPVTSIDQTWSNPGSYSTSVGVGCYKITANGAGGGASGSYSWLWYRGENGGQGGHAEVFFCVNSGYATVNFYVGAGGYNACYGNCAGRGGETRFNIVGDLDSRFSGIGSGQWVYAYGGYGGCGYRWYSSSYSASSGCYGGAISGGYGGRYLPSNYHSIISGFGTRGNTLTYASCGSGSAGGQHVNYYCGNNGANGSIIIKTIKTKVAMY